MHLNIRLSDNTAIHNLMIVMDVEVMKAKVKMVGTEFILGDY